MSINPAGEPLPIDVDDAFDDWLSGASINKRSVEIYAKPGLAAEYEQLERDLERAEEAEKHGAEMGGRESRQIIERMAELYEEWMASKSVWTVRGVNEAMSDRIRAEVPEVPPLVEPTKPEPLRKNATPQESKNHTLAMQAYDKARAEYEAALPAHEREVAKHTDETNLRYIAAAVEKIELGDGRTIEAEYGDDGDVVTPAVSVEKLRQMKVRLGDAQLARVLLAMQVASVREPVISGPFSRASSTTENDEI